MEKRLVNFIEAVNSGKRFKPVDDPDDSWYGTDMGHVIRLESKNHYDTNSVKFINSMFFLEEKKVTISESEFEAILKDSYSNLKADYKEYAYPPKVQAEYIKKRMGF